jgi:L-seryl-tRNA(Ser) seleniumtransferase
MPFTADPHRRSFLTALSAAVTGLLMPNRMLGKATAAAPAPAGLSGFGSSGNVYEELGVTPVINAQGTMTVLGGSLMRPEVEAVMSMAGRHFVPILELEAAAGKRIAKMLKLPDGYDAIVTSGAAAAMQSGLAGILTADNPQFIQQLPDLTGMKSEVIIQQSHRNPFDHQLRATGVKLVVVETKEQLLGAINPRTAMMHFSNFADANGSIKVEEWVQIAHAHNVAAFIDAAADTPPVSHLWDYAHMGYDLIAFSGGKAIRGPQCAGLLVGRKDLVAYALMNNSPNEDTLGRSQKVGKEEIVGMIKALESYLAEDHDALNREWQRRLEYISGVIAKVPGVSTHFMVPAVANHVPHMIIDWDPKRVSASPAQISAALRQSKPSIAIEPAEQGGGLSMNSFMLQPGEERIIAERLTQLLQAHAA